MRQDRSAGFDPADSATRANPFPAYHWLRDEAPVHRPYPGQPLFLLSRYEDVSRALRDAKTFSSALPLAAPTMSILFMDAPDHERIRASVSRAFAWRHVRALARRVEALAIEQLEGVEGHVEWIAGFANPLPVHVICEMLGIPKDRLSDMRRWSRDLLLASVPTGGAPNAEWRERSRGGVIELLEYLKEVVAAREGARDESILSALLDCRDEGALDDHELLHFCGLLLFAGHETTTLLIANGSRILAERPELWRRLAGDPGRIPDFVEEVVRFASPLQRTARRTTCSVELHGVEVPAGSLVLLMLGAANRDPRRFEHPDRFDLDRPLRSHLGFGEGRHSCLGASLARLEGRIAFEQMLARLEPLEVDPLVPPVPITSYGAGNFGWESLPLVVTRRRP
jgi:cytochrome P450